MKRLVYHVSGTPQWEGYSDEVIKIARNIGLTGYVHNLMDGRMQVLIAFLEINKDHVAAFQEFANWNKPGYVLAGVTKRKCKYLISSSTK